MKWIDKLERKYGRYGIPNLTVLMIACYVVGYLLEASNSGLLPYLCLSPGLILKGQIWRLVTWVISSPSSGNILLFAISILFFYYPIGTSLERTWGSFRYTLYILMGMLFTVIGAFLLYFVTGGIIGGGYYYLDGSIFTTYYISLSVFLAYAMTYPDMQILLWFVIPIKMRWMAYVYGAIIAYEVISYIRQGYWFMVVPIIASLLNFLIFFLGSGRMNRYNPKQVHRRAQFQRAVSQGQAQARHISKHKCAICGRTEQDDPTLEFRFCSRCNGNYEYCQDHLFTHEHVK
jgi:hypothetical protein